MCVTWCNDFEALGVDMNPVIDELSHVTYGTGEVCVMGHWLSLNTSLRDLRKTPRKFRLRAWEALCDARAKARAFHRAMVALEMSKNV